MSPELKRKRKGVQLQFRSSFKIRWKENEFWGAKLLQVPASQHQNIGCLIAKQKRKKLFPAKNSTTFFAAPGALCRTAFSCYVFTGALDPFGLCLSGHPNPSRELLDLKKRRQKWLAEKMTAIQSAQKRFASGEWQTDVTAIIPLDEVIDRLPEELAKPNGKVFIQP